MINPWKHLSNINPQRENGNRQISNEVYRALMAADLTAAEYKVILCIIDRTWGYNKPVDAISVSQIMTATSLAERTIQVTLKALRERQIIYYEQSTVRAQHGTPLNAFLFNKHWDTWKVKGVSQCTHKDSGRVHKDAPIQKERVQNTVGKGAEPCAGRVHCDAPTKESTPTKESIKKRCRSKKPTDPRIAEFIRIYHDSYETAFCVKPVIMGSRDGPCVKRMLTRCAVDILVGNLKPYFESQDLFIKNNAYDIPRFEKFVAAKAVGGYQDQKGVGHGQSTAGRSGTPESQRSVTGKACGDHPPADKYAGVGQELPTE